MYLLFGLGTGCYSALFNQHAGMATRYLTNGLLHIGFRGVFVSKTRLNFSNQFANDKSVIVMIMFHLTRSALKGLAKCSVADGQNGLMI